MGHIDSNLVYSINMFLASHRFLINFLEAEVRLLSKVKHENLVALVGFCEVTGKKIMKMGLN